MPINNLEKIIPLINLEHDGDIVFIEIIQRGKDVGKTGEYLIKDYHIHSVDQLREKMEEIITICDAFHARAYIRLNRCNIDVANTLAVREIIKRDADRKTALLNGNKPPKIISLAKMFGSILGSLAQKTGDGSLDETMDGAVEPKATRKWIVDVDAPTAEENCTLDEKIEAWSEVVNKCEPIVDKHGKPVGNKVIARIPSKTGMHLITKPFGKDKFSQLVGKDTNGDSFVKSSGITNLYIAD